MSRAAGAMERISARGRRLYAGRRSWRAWGMNWGRGDRYSVLRYFDQPTPAGLRSLRAELRTARELGANSLRLPLELTHVMRSPTSVRKATLSALQRLLRAAEQERLYLDITGNLVWRPQLAPAWYERLDKQDRWNVQERFWRAVAQAAANSPAVLCYELTSEPVVSDIRERYLGELEGYTFMQNIARPGTREPVAVARAWTSQLAAAVRSCDDRPVTIGLLPLSDHAFAADNVADLLDLVIVHEYPRQGRASESAALVRTLAGLEKPLLLGETFPIFCDAATQREFLTQASRHVVGVLGFFDGRDPGKMAADTVSDRLYQEALLEFTALRPAVLRRGGAALSTASSGPAPGFAPGRTAQPD